MSFTGLMMIIFKLHGNDALEHLSLLSNTTRISELPQNWIKNEKRKKKLERSKKTFEADFSASNSKKKTTAEKKIEILC